MPNTDVPFDGRYSKNARERVKIAYKLQMPKSVRTGPPNLPLILNWRRIIIYGIFCLDSKFECKVQLRRLARPCRSSGELSGEPGENVCVKWRAMARPCRLGGEPM